MPRTSLEVPNDVFGFVVHHGDLLGKLKKTRKFDRYGPVKYAKFWMETKVF